MSRVCHFIQMEQSKTNWSPPMSPVREHLSFATLRKAPLETSLLPFPGLPPFASPSQTAPAWHTLPQFSWLLQINIYISWVFCFSSGKLALNVIDFFFCHGTVRNEASHQKGESRGQGIIKSERWGRRGRKG